MPNWCLESRWGTWDETEAITTRHRDVGEAVFTRPRPRLRQHWRGRGEVRQLRIRPRRGRGKAVRNPCICIKLNSWGNTHTPNMFDLHLKTLFLHRWSYVLKDKRGRNIETEAIPRRGIKMLWRGETEAALLLPLLLPWRETSTSRHTSLPIITCVCLNPSSTTTFVTRQFVSDLSQQYCMHYVTW